MNITKQIGNTPARGFEPTCTCSRPLRALPPQNKQRQ